MDILAELKSKFRYEFSAQIVAAVSGALLTVSLARLLTSEDYGLFYLSIAIFSLVRLFSTLGIPRSTSRYLSEYLEKGKENISYILEISISFLLVTTTIVSISLYVGSGKIAELISEPEILPLLQLGVLYIISRTIYRYVRNVLLGLQAIRQSSAIYSLDYFLRFVFSVTLVLLGMNGTGALLGFIIGTTISTIIGSLYLYHKYYSKTEFQGKKERGLRKKIVNYSIPLTFTSLSKRMDNQIDTILVGFFLSPMHVGFYVVGRQVIAFLQTAAEAINTSVSPSYASLKQKEKANISNNIFEMTVNKTIHFYLTASVGLYIIAQDFIIIVFGREYMGSVPVLRVLTIYLLILSISTVLDRPLDYLGLGKENAIYRTFTTIFNIVLNIILIPLYGVIGAAVATTVSRFIYLAFQSHLMSKEVDINLPNIIKEILKSSLLSAVIAVCVILLLPCINGIVSLLLISVAGFILWIIGSIISGQLKINSFL